MGDTFHKLREAIRQSGKQAVVAKVIATDPGLLTADVTIEGESIVRERIPLRIFNDSGGLGMAFVPKVGSQVIVGFIDGSESRPGVIKVQEWDIYIMRKGPADMPAFELVVDSNNQIFLRRGENFRLAVERDDRISLESGSTYNLEIAANGKLTFKTVADVLVECVNAKVKASGNIDLGESGTGVHTQQSMPMCFVTAAPIPCSQTVKAKM
jgi:hypothetical protein